MKIRAKKLSQNKHATKITRKKQPGPLCGPTGRFLIDLGVSGGPKNSSTWVTKQVLEVDLGPFWAPGGIFLNFRSQNDLKMEPQGLPEPPKIDQNPRKSRKPAAQENNPTEQPKDRKNEEDSIDKNQPTHTTQHTHHQDQNSFNTSPTSPPSHNHATTNPSRGGCCAAL